MKTNDEMYAAVMDAAVDAGPEDVVTALEVIAGGRRAIIAGISLVLAGNEIPVGTRMGTEIMQEVEALIVKHLTRYQRKTAESN